MTQTAQHTPGPWSEANARLLVAAPELLAALRAALYTLDENEEGFGSSKAEAIKQVRAAIAKATA